MAKILKVSFPQKCIGCELCVAEVQRQLGKIGLEGSPIRIFKNKQESILLDKIIYTIELSPDTQDLQIEKIKSICPTGVFTIEKASENEDGELLE